jgi:Flp pilus assembly protein TadG
MAVKNLRRARGSVMIYTVIAMPVLLLVAGLSVDWGRVQLVRNEMGRTCDAAARYAVTGMADGTTLAKANWIAARNPVDGGNLITFSATDVQTGIWNATTKVFTPTTTAPNALRVTSTRTVESIFASLAGGAPKTVTVRAVVKRAVVGFGLVGLDGIYFGGNSTTSYSSAGGAMGGSGNIASNGPILISGSSTVNGDIYYRAGQTVSGGTVTGTKNLLSSPLSYPNGNASPYSSSNNDNSYLPTTIMSGNSINMNNKSVTVPGGHYFINNFDLSGSSSITFTGPTTIYCYGSFSMSGNTATSGSIPGNLKLVMVPDPSTGAAPGSVTIGGTASLYADIYAPQSNVSIAGTGDIYGGILGKTVAVTGSGSIIYDEALDSNNGKVELVQ